MSTRSFRRAARCVAANLVVAVTLAASVVAGGPAPRASAWLDTSFRSALSATDQVFAVAPDSDGSVWAGGDFSVFGKNLVHLNRNGTVDLEVNGAITTGFDAPVRTIALLGNRVWVGGDFTAFNGTPTGHLVELNRDGTLYNAFASSFGARVWKILPLTYNTMLVMGSFDAPDAHRLVKLGTGGAIDTAFAANLAGGFDSTVRDAAVQPDGGIVVVGDFTSAGGALHRTIARASAAGVVDSSFNASTDGIPLAVGVLSTGRILVGGNFTKVDDTARSYFAFLSPNGSLVPVGLGGLSTVVVPDGLVRDIDVLPGDLSLVAGAFGHFGSPSGSLQRGVVKVSPNGLLLSPFDEGVGAGAGSTVYSIASLPDGRLVYGGQFTEFANQLVNNVAVVTTGPTLPRKLAATPRNGSALVTVTLPSGDGGNPVLRMVVSYTGLDGAGYTACTITSVIFENVTASCGGMKNGITYVVSATAYNKESGSGAATVKVTPRTVPTVPRLPKVTFPAAGKARVAWTAPASNGGAPITRYDVCRAACTIAASWHSTGLTAGKPNLFSVAAVQKGTKVTMKIRAVNVAGASPQASLTFTQTK